MLSLNFPAWSYLKFRWIFDYFLLNMSITKFSRLKHFVFFFGILQTKQKSNQTKQTSFFLLIFVHAIFDAVAVCTLGVLKKKNFFSQFSAVSHALLPLFCMYIIYVFFLALHCTRHITIIYSQVGKKSDITLKGKLSINKRKMQKYKENYFKNEVAKKL